LLIIFPSFFWLLLETSTTHSRKLPHYGPKQVHGKNDTTFYQVQALPMRSDHLPPGTIQAVMFIRDAYRGDSYRLQGVWEYLSYKNSKIEHIPIVLVTGNGQTPSVIEQELERFKKYSNVHFTSLAPNEFTKMNLAYFNGKPYYSDYSCFVLVDEDRHVRGYYDGRYVAEIKRMIGEYQYLRLKEEKKKIIENDSIKQKRG
jgi:hypothetical protein